jgi:hypothetical protein
MSLTVRRLLFHLIVAAAFGFASVPLAHAATTTTTLGACKYDYAAWFAQRASDSTVGRVVRSPGLQPRRATVPAVTRLGVAAEEEAALARGGVYTLRDEAGDVIRTGRTNDLAARESAHFNDPVLGDYRFSVEYRTDVYAEQRGLEQVLSTTATRAHGSRMVASTRSAASSLPTRTGPAT